MKRFKLIVTFIVSILIVIITIKAINYLPLIIQKDTMRRYESIEEVKERLGIKDLLIPTYYPQDLIWPPSEIFAQGRPFMAVTMEFRNSRSGRTDLVISQSSSERFKVGKLNIKKSLDSVVYSFKGRKILVVTGFCENGDTCTRASWVEGRYRITVTGRLDPPQLSKIVESMIH